MDDDVVGKDFIEHKYSSFNACVSRVGLVLQRVFYWRQRRTEVASGTSDFRAVLHEQLVDLPQLNYMHMLKLQAE
jgi:hypothetical protein